MVARRPKPHISANGRRQPARIAASQAEPPGPPPTYHVHESDAGLGDLLNILFRRKWFVLGVVFASVVLVSVSLQFVTPRYDAETLILLEPQQVTIPTVDSVLAGRTADDQGVRSQVEVLQSRGLAAAVVDKLGLDGDPEFNSGLRPPGLVAKTLALFGRDIGDGTASRSAIVDSFLNKLDVEAVKDSRVLSVVITSVDAEKAAAISNAVADQYLLSQLETKYEATKVANDWLNERVSDLREQVAASEQAVEDFRETAELLQTEGGTLTAQQIAELNGQLVLARAAEAEARARLRQLSSLISSEDGVASASEVLDSALIQRLKEQQTEVERRVAELSAEYGPSHPRMIQLQAEAQDLAQRIDSEVNKVVRNLSNEVAIAAAREESLQSELARLKNVMARSNDKEIQLRALEREAEASRALLATLLARFREISSQDEMQPQQAGARIISRADAPSQPSFPNKAFMLGIVIPLSALLAIIAVFIMESLQRGFVSGEQIEQETGMTSLGFVPLLGTKGLRKIEPATYMLEQPRSAFAQALRTAYWSLTIAVPAGPTTVVVTSSHPGEGKSTIALGLARARAVSGHRTLLIDADTRNPSIHDVLDAENSVGLTDYLSGKCEHPTINVDQETGLEFITAGQPVEDPLPLLDSRTMDELIGFAEGEYEFVVIDTPPIIAGLDACALSRKVDTTMLVVRWSRTPKTVVAHTLRELGRTRGHLSGTLLNMVDVGKHAQYHYGDSGAYHGALRKYYSEEG
ncbi:MAG: polysaccharide biosynthesis tyrosine autokinase [Gammaproteobacteria bacterium]|nr:polysaccharide biosynthesis tyrosine autokinase [Gammaproteobacteria bacterium]